MKKIKGLTQKEVEEKIKQGKINKIKIKTNESFSKIICKNIFTYFNFIFLIWFYKHKLVLHKNTPSAVLSGKESIIVTSIFIMSKLFMRNYLCYKKMLGQKTKTLMPTDCSVLRTSAILPII